MTSTHRPTPRFAGWARSAEGDTWTKLSEGATRGEALERLMDLPGANEFAVLPTDELPNAGTLPQLKRGLVTVTLRIAP